MPLDRATTAVVLIEYQNDFTTEGGVLHSAVQPVMDKTAMLANTVRLVDAARAAGATVMHAPITFAESYHELSQHPYGILKGVVDGTAFVKDSWGAASANSSARHRRTSSSRASAAWTRSPAPTSTSSCATRESPPSSWPGSSPAACVESTMRTGYERGYDVITLTDCTAATSVEEHDNASATSTPCSPSR